MSTILSDAVLAQTSPICSSGKNDGGLAFYISGGMPSKIGWSAAKVVTGICSVAIMLELGFIDNASQASSIASAGTEAFEIPSLAVRYSAGVMAGMTLYRCATRTGHDTLCAASCKSIAASFVAFVFLFRS
ncbi:alanine:cation symporter family protein, partial [Neisseria animaloris]|uniref:alanine:cation symporter family protein n=1 Tax=Neisseria animaloris TaxID=326522 RepID=UPI0020123133